MPRDTLTKPVIRQRQLLETASDELLDRLKAQYPAVSGNGGPDEQDTVLTTEAIGKWISSEFFPCSARKASYLFERYGSRPGGPGFFKLSGTVALSKSRFRAWYAAKTGVRS
jgi:hypothetical protein